MTQYKAYADSLIRQMERAAKDHASPIAEYGMLLPGNTIKRIDGDNVFHVTGQAARFLDLLEGLQDHVNDTKSLTVKIYLSYLLPQQKGDGA